MQVRGVPRVLKSTGQGVDSTGQRWTAICLACEPSLTYPGSSAPAGQPTAAVYRGSTSPGLATRSPGGRATTGRRRRFVMSCPQEGCAPSVARRFELPESSARSVLVCAYEAPAMARRSQRRMASPEPEIAEGPATSAPGRVRPRATRSGRPTHRASPQPPPRHLHTEQRAMR